MWVDGSKPSPTGASQSHLVLKAAKLGFTQDDGFALFLLF